MEGPDRQEPKRTEDDSVPPSALVPKRRTWLVLLIVLLVLGGGATAVVLLVRGATDPMTVLVAVELEGPWWHGSKPSAIIADRVAERLEALGFKPLKAGDPELTALLEDAESPEQAAKAVGAAFVIGGRLEPQVIEHPLERAYFETRVQGTITLTPVGEAAADVGEVSSWSGAPARETALELLARALADKVFDAAIPAIMADPRLTQMIAGPVEDKARVGLARGYVELRAKSLSTARAAYDALPLERKAKELSRHEVRYHGAFDRNVALAAVSEKGVLLREVRWRPFFSPGKNELAYHDELERLLWLSPDGAREEVIFEGYNIFGYPDADAKGQRVVLIEDLFGAARAITLLEGTAAPKRLRVDGRRWPGEPKVSPDGSRVALWDRACRRCPARLLVLALPNAEQLFASEEGETSLAGFTWLGPSTIAMLERPAPAKGSDTDDDSADASAQGEQRLVEVELSTDPVRTVVLHTSVAGESYGPPTCSRDGRYVAMTRYGDYAAGLAVFDRTEKKLSVHSTDVRVERPVLSPDGTTVAFQTSGDIALLALADGKLTRLTRNPFVERYPLFSRDGRRVWFESQSRDPSFDRKNLGVAASVTLP